MRVLKPIHIEHLKQGSPEWHLFRNKGLGSSDAGVISGLMPEAWDGYYSLKRQRTGLSKKSFSPEKEIIITRGQDLEEEARQAYVALRGLEMSPACFIHPRRDWQRSSLDGIDDDWSTILEIKCSGEKVYNKVAYDLDIPNYYFAQMQHQLATVPSATKAHFWMYDPERGGVLIEVLPDPKFIRELIKREEWFWNALQEDRRIYSGMMGSPIKFEKNYTVLHNPHEKPEETESTDGPVS
jgi:putative phage-type endonuclease